jgi:predicted amidohydrolase
MKVAIVTDPETVAAGAGAELIVLPQLSFCPYLPAHRDRAGLELAERPPSPAYERTLEGVGAAWVAASAYECEGEGVFYLTQYLGRAGSADRSSYRQIRIEAAPRRYEQMFFSPGHDGYAVGDAEGVPIGLLVGADAKASAAYASLAELGADMVVAGVAEDAEGWAAVSRTASGAAAEHGLAVAIANRGDEWFGGEALALDRRGARIAADADGIFEIEAAGAAGGASGEEER